MTRSSAPPATMDIPSLFSRANSTAPPTASWHSSPNTRGTWDIVSTCIATLLICAWKAVHIDIPLNKSQSSFTDKLGWLVVGILAPDMLLFTAFSQLQLALHNRRCARKYLDCPPEPPGWRGDLSRYLGYAGSRLKALWPSRVVGLFSKEGQYGNLGDEEAVTDHTQAKNPSREEPQGDANDAARHTRKHPWTLVHSFYAAMGGFAFETSTPILGSRTRFALTKQGIVFLMEHAPELIPDLPEDRILNRSQSDNLGKALLIAQLLYFCISCAARGAQSLSLSLLEVSTLAHALCGVATYLVWWHKPFDVPEPTVISGAHADEAAAFLLLISPAEKKKALGASRDTCFSESHYLAISRTAESNDRDSSEAAATADEGLEELNLRPGQEVRVGDFTFSFNDKDLDPDRYSVYGGDALPWFQRNRGRGNSVRLDKVDLARWRLAERAMARLPARDSRIERVFVTWREDLRWAFQFLEADNETKWIFLLSAIVAVYGSFHLLGLGSTFPTSVEHTMWRVGGLTMIILSTAPLVLILLGGLVFWFAELASFSDDVVELITLALGAIPVVIYSAISAFLIVESIRQLFYLPDSAFKLPNFSVYFPHFA